MVSQGSKRLLRSLGVPDCAQAGGGASAVGADRLCLSLCAVSICCSTPDAGLPLPEYGDGQFEPLFECYFDPRNPIDLE